MLGQRSNLEPRRPGPDCHLLNKGHGLLFASLKEATSKKKTWLFPKMVEGSSFSLLASDATFLFSRKQSSARRGSQTAGEAFLAPSAVREGAEGAGRAGGASPGPWRVCTASDFCILCRLIASLTDGCRNPRIRRCSQPLAIYSLQRDEKDGLCSEVTY